MVKKMYKLSTLSNCQIVNNCQKMSKNVNNVESCQHWAQGKFWSSKNSQFLVINMWEKILRITLKYFCVPMLAVPVKCNLCQSHPKPGLPHSPHMQRSQSLLEQPKIASFPVCRIILGSPKHVLHFFWSSLDIYEALKTTLKVSLTSYLSPANSGQTMTINKGNLFQLFFFWKWDQA